MKTIIILLIVSISISGLFAFAKETSKTTSSVDLDIDIEKQIINEKLGFAYWYGTQCILQDAKPSAYLVLDPNTGEYLGGILGKSTRADFCTNVSSTTIGVSLIIPRKVCQGFLSMLGAAEAYVALDTYEKETVLTIVMVDDSEGTDLKDPSLFYGEKDLEQTLHRKGVDKYKFYKYMKEKGYTTESLFKMKDKDKLVDDTKKEIIKTNKKLTTAETYIIIIITIILITIIARSFKIVKKIEEEE